MVGFEIDFHYRSIEAWEAEKLSLQQTKRTPYAALDNETSGNENCRRARIKFLL